MLPLSYHLKLKYPNQILQAYEKPDKIPDLHELVYTQVLTKQSALFNAWKLLCEISDTQGVPIRLTPSALLMAANVEASTGGGGKKQDKKKKVESMLITLPVETEKLV